MKKWLIVVSVMLFAASLHAADFKTWQSSHTETAETGVTIFSGPGRLYKVIVSSAGAASGIAIYDAQDGTGNVPFEVAGIDTTSVDDIVFDIALSSGLTYDHYGTDLSSVEILYKQYDRFGAFVSTFTRESTDDATLFMGPGTLHKVIVSSAMAAGTGIDIFDAMAGTAQGDRIVRVAGDAVHDVVYDIHVSSGLRYNPSGTLGVTIIYKQGR